MTKFIFPACFTALRESNFKNNNNITIIFGDEIHGSALNSGGWNAISGYPVVVNYSATPPASGGSNLVGRICYVPDEAVDAYKAAWPTVASRYRPLSEWEG